MLCVVVVQMDSHRKRTAAASKRYRQKKREGQPTRAYHRRTSAEVQALLETPYQDLSKHDKDVVLYHRLRHQQSGEVCIWLDTWCHASGSDTDTLEYVCILMSNRSCILISTRWQLLLFILDGMTTIWDMSVLML